jgi:transposase
MGVMPKVKLDLVLNSSRQLLPMVEQSLLPRAKIVFDHFHVIKLFNDKLTDLRRALYRGATDVIQKAVLKRTRWLLQMAKTLAAHRTGLLAYYDVMISSGPMEGTNNKIKAMKRQAYGFRDMGFVKLKILAIHETRYALIG